MGLLRKTTCAAKFIILVSTWILKVTLGPIFQRTEKDDG